MSLYQLELDEESIAMNNKAIRFLLKRLTDANTEEIGQSESNGPELGLRYNGWLITFDSCNSYERDEDESWDDWRARYEYRLQAEKVWGWDGQGCRGRHLRTTNLFHVLNWIKKHCLPLSDEEVAAQVAEGAEK